MSDDFAYTISYGKLAVPFYRTHALPLTGLRPIPESAYTGCDNVLFAAEMDVEVFGENFLPAYTQGDNSRVVATDSMKNFVLRQALDYDGATLEGFVNTLGRRFLDTYADMEALRLTARELPFTPVPVPNADGSGFVPSNVLLQRRHDDYGMATLDFQRDGNGGAVLADHRCARVGLQLLKITGSAFTRFVRDAYTTLPERGDRPLFIFMDIAWRYTDPQVMLRPDGADYVAGEQVRDIVQVLFHDFVSESIQHLVHRMGQRLLERFPQLAEVSFAAQNRTRDPIATSGTDDTVKVYSDPFPAYGEIKLTVKRHGK